MKQVFKSGKKYILINRYEHLDRIKMDIVLRLGFPIHNELPRKKFSMNPEKMFSVNRYIIVTSNVLNYELIYGIIS